MLDLGSGIGSVGMIAAWRLPGARVRDDRGAGGERSAGAQVGRVQRPRLTATRSGTAISGMPARSRADDERFDLVLGSPPYFPPGTGIEGDHPQKVACRFELRGDIRDYARVAAAHLAPAACSRVCFPRSSARASKRAASDAGLVIVRRRPVVFSEGEPPLVTLVRDDARSGPA